MLAIARSLALEAAAEIMRLRDFPLEKGRKENQSLVTSADLNSDKIIREGLEKDFPNHCILSEESRRQGNPDSDYVWLVDPLDGTKAYAKGIAGFAVMVGLLKDLQPYLGVIVDPLEDFVYEAIRGEGTFLIHKNQRKQIRVSTRNEFDKMPLVVSPGFPDERLQTIKDELNCPLINPINSVGIKVGHLVRQEADIYLTHHLVHAWDTCAPQIVLEEAGGVMTKINGSELTYDLKEPYYHDYLTIATNGTRHADLVEWVGKARPPSP